MEFPSGKIAFDREFALVDSSGTAMRLQACPRMGFLCPVIDVDARTMTVTAPGRDDLVLYLDSDQRQVKKGNRIVSVCGNKCGGILWGDYAASEWFSSFLGVQCWLARYCNGEYLRPSEAEKSPNTRNPLVSFANEQPLLLVAENAVDHLNKVLLEQNQRQVSARQFRPNVVVKSQVKTWSQSEDHWQTLTFMDKHLILQAKGSCARCTMVDFDPMTGRKGKTLRALASYRRKKGQINFGIFLKGVPGVVTDANGVLIEEGDKILCT